MRTQEEARKTAGDSDLVFTTRTGTPIEPRKLQPGLRKPLPPSRRPAHPRPRHPPACASLLAALDVHPRVAMRILRHSQISMTMDVYTRIPSPKRVWRLTGSIRGSIA